MTREALTEIVLQFLEQHTENDQCDFKQEWHENIADLIKDIVCFSNTLHDNDSYLIFGISDDFQVVGMKQSRRKQADIIDSIQKLDFAGNVYPSIEIQTIELQGICVDVLVIHNEEKTPIYLSKPYGKMNCGCIYTRVGDRNTRDRGNANAYDIENLWKKRFKLTSKKVDRILHMMKSNEEWYENEHGYSYEFQPEYAISYEYEDDRSKTEFYSYAMTNSKTVFGTIKLTYKKEEIYSRQIALLDSGRLTIPIPEWSFIPERACDNFSRVSYKYFTLDSQEYKILSFSYDEHDSDAQFAMDHLRRVVLFYSSDNERIQFEQWINKHFALIQQCINETDQYSWVESRLDKYRLKTGYTLVNMLGEWRRSNYSSN